MQGFHFLRPEKEGEILAIRKTFPRLPFKQLAWVVHLNCLFEEGRGVYEWKAEEMVHPLDRTLKKYFESSEYKKRVRRVQKERRFDIDWQAFRNKSADAVREGK